MTSVLLMEEVNEQKTFSKVSQIDARQVQSIRFRWCANLGSCVVADDR